MVFFDFFALLLSGAFFTSALLTGRVSSIADYRRGLAMLVTSLILYYPASGLLAIGAYISIVARPLAVVLAVLSLRSCCLALTRVDGSTTVGRSA